MAERFRGWLRTQRRMRRALRNTYVYRILGERIFHNHIWKVDVNSLAGGLALGLFVAFTPTIPFQMLMCAVGAVLLRVNLPMALAACWITNPLTALPIFLSARRLGVYLLENSAVAELALGLFGMETRTGRFMEQAAYLWAGSLFLATVAALLGYLLVRLLGCLGHSLTVRFHETHREKGPE